MNLGDSLKKDWMVCQEGTIRYTECNINDQWKNDTNEDMKFKTNSNKRTTTDERKKEIFFWWNAVYVIYNDGSLFDENVYRVEMANMDQILIWNLH